MAQSSSWRRTRYIYIYIYSIYIYKILGFYPRLTLERRQPTFLFLGIGTSKSSARCDQHDDAARQKRHVGNRKRQWLQFRREIRRRRDGRLSHGFVFFFFPYLVSRRQNYRRLHCKALWLEIRKRSGPVFIDPKRGPYRELDTTIVLQRGPILTRAPKPNFLFSPLFIFITFYKNTEQKKNIYYNLIFSPFVTIFCGSTGLDPFKATSSSSPKIQSIHRIVDCLCLSTRLQTDPSSGSLDVPCALYTFLFFL